MIEIRSATDFTVKEALLTGRDTSMPTLNHEVGIEFILVLPIHTVATLTTVFSRFYMPPCKPKMLRFLFCLLLISTFTAQAFGDNQSHLIKKSNHRNKKIRLSATLALKKFNTKRSHKALKKRLSKDKNSRVRLAAALTIKRLLQDVRSWKKFHEDSLLLLENASTKDKSKKVRRYCQVAAIEIKKLRLKKKALAVSLRLQSKELSPISQNILLKNMVALIKRYRKLHVVSGDREYPNQDHYRLGYKHAPIKSIRQGLHTTVHCKVSVRASVMVDRQESWQSRKMAVATSSAEVVGPSTHQGVRSSKETCILASMKHVTQKELIPFLLTNIN